MREEVDKTQKRIYFDPSKDFWPFLNKVWAGWIAGYDGGGLVSWPLHKRRLSAEWLIMYDGYGLRVFYNGPDISISGIFTNSWVFLFSIDRALTKGGVVLKTPEEVYEFLVS